MDLSRCLVVPLPGGLYPNAHGETPMLAWLRALHSALRPLGELKLLDGRSALVVKICCGSDGHDGLAFSSVMSTFGADDFSADGWNEEDGWMVAHVLLNDLEHPNVDGVEAIDFYFNDFDGRAEGVYKKMLDVALWLRRTLGTPSFDPSRIVQALTLLANVG